MWGEGWEGPAGRRQMGTHRQTGREQGAPWRAWVAPQEGVPSACRLRARVPSDWEKPPKYPCLSEDSVALRHTVSPLHKVWYRPYLLEQNPTFSHSLSVKCCLPWFLLRANLAAHHPNHLWFCTLPALPSPALAVFSKQMVLGRATFLLSPTPSPMVTLFLLSGGALCLQQVESSQGPCPCRMTLHAGPCPCPAPWCLLFLESTGLSAKPQPKATSFPSVSVSEAETRKTILEVNKGKGRTGSENEFTGRAATQCTRVKVNRGIVQSWVGTM